MMRNRMLCGLLLVGMAAQAQVGAKASDDAGIRKAEASVRPQNIRAQVKFISDDLFEGRYPGLRGGELAAKYIATQFALYGLTPAGDDGTYLQQIDFVGMKVKAAETTFAVEGKGSPMMLKFGDDFVAWNPRLTAATDIDAPIVFVGYGATAPEFGWDDYAGVDVKGKVILCIVGDPPSSDPKFFGGDALTYYGRWTYKFEQAARKGAVGAMIIHRADLASYGWDVVRNSNSSEKTFLRDDANPRVRVASWVQLDVAKRMFAASGMTLDGAFEAAGKRGFKAVELPLRLKAHVSSEVRKFQSANVVGMLQGANVSRPIKTVHTPCPEGALCDPTKLPKALDQAAMYTAHYDHLGFVPGMAGDNIYNGAADNGTGVGMLLEMARAWSAAGLRLPHSVIFAAVTAEEQGLLGSEYLGQHPPVPAAQIALDINYDMLVPIGVQKEVNVNGAQRTTFYPEVEATAKRFGLAIVPDPTPSHGSYYRSDHFSLSRVGIPAFSVDAGTLYEGHDHAWGAAQEKDFNDNRYHNFSDNFDETWDFRGDANLVRFGMDLGWQVIHAPKTVEWNTGDEFEAARKASEGK
ncbi:MAG TPA: M28 family peptidase [Acidobacteriaceae bacterium]|nr:M28 family peptidase [Acidobacteriaceae bacterium]